MGKVYVVVEGETEETFVDELLAPHLNALGHRLVLLPEEIQNYSRVKKRVRSLLRDTTASLVTTMFDYYGLPKKFPGRKKPEGVRTLDKVRFVEAQFRADIGDPRFHPYLSLHEFEALLFSDPGKIALALGLDDRLTTRLSRIRASFPTPEDIDDDPTTAPSKRLVAVFPGYVKPIDGVRIANDIGLETIRQECPHFNDWLTLLDGIG
jgi:hypothetical protein